MMIFKAHINFPAPKETDKEAHAAMLGQLRRYVDSWIAGSSVWPDFLAWAQQNPDLVKALSNAVETARYRLMGTATGAAAVMVNAGVQPALKLARRDAAALFLAILADQNNQKLRRCAYKPCRRYFLNTSGREDKTYCSRQCATRDAARRTMEKRREEEKANRLAVAEPLIQKWNDLTEAQKRRAGGVWRAWVTGESHHKLTKTWLTRAVNRGWLSPPARPVNERAHNGSARGAVPLPGFSLARKLRG
jgi:predicted RNA-binding Zn ribbon-like protein